MDFLGRCSGYIFMLNEVLVYHCLQYDGHTYTAIHQAGILGLIFVRQA